MVLVLDTYERLATLDDWVRSELIPGLPATALTVIAGRAAPGARFRVARTPRWLEELGYDRPAEERVEVDLSYATCVYRLPPDLLDGDWGTLQAPTPQLPRGGALARLEKDRWMLTLMSMTGDRAPAEPDGLREFARSLRFPDIHKAVRDAEPVHGPVTYRFPANVRHRYERLNRLPDGLLVVGDGVCSLNPVYGQGMTIAALEALALRAHIERYGVPRPRRFQRDIARLVDVPWEMAMGADLTFPGVRGRRTRKQRVLAAYISRLHAVASHDASLATTFLRVSHLVDPPRYAPAARRRRPGSGSGEAIR